MRLAYLSSRYPSVTHTFIAREIAELRRLGVDIETIAVRNSPPDEVLSEADRREQRATHVLVPPSVGTFLEAHARGLIRHPLAYLSTLFHALRLSPGGFRAAVWQVFYFAEAVLLWRHCVRRRIRHVHVHFANVAADVAMLATRFANAADGRPGAWTWSFTMHSQVSQQMDGTTDFYDAVRHRLRWKVEDTLFVACVSDFDRSRLMSMVDPTHWAKLKLLRCGVDVEEFHPTPRQPATDGPVRILTVGRLLALKGHALLLEAAAQLRAAGKAVEVTIVGAGPEDQRLVRLARDLGIAGDVTFAGAVGRDAIHTYYSAADVFCLPSFAEGLPVVLMEAAAAGLPVVATRIAGIPELVGHEESGLLVSPGRADLLAEALGRLQESPDLRRRMGQAARTRVTAEFEIGRCSRRMQSAFVSALADS